MSDQAMLEAQGQPVPDGGPEEQAEAPQMASPPVDPMSAGALLEANTAENDVPEVEARDTLGLQLILAAREMASATMVARGADNYEAAEKYASSAHKLTQAIVLLVPVTAADDLVNGNTGTGLATNRERLDQ